MKSMFFDGMTGTGNHSDYTLLSTNKAWNLVKIFCFITVFLFDFSPGYSQAGLPDSTFAGKGWIYTDYKLGNNYHEQGLKILQDNGSYIILFAANGHTRLTRLLANGDTDINFGISGFTEPILIEPSHAARQTDGKIIVFGTTSTAYTRAFTLVRFATDGFVDSSFGENGIVTTFFGEVESAGSLAIQDDGKIVVVGGTRVTNSVESDFAVARFNVDGNLDITFDGDGKLTTDFLQSDDVARTVAIQNDGKIVVAGTVFNDEEPVFVGFAVARYNANGSLDISFDGDGKLTTEFENNGAFATSLVIQNDNKIVVGGYTTPGIIMNMALPPSFDFLLARYNTDGSMDTTFDYDGKIITDVGGDRDQLFTLAMQPDRKILAAGSASLSGIRNPDFAIVRYNGNGSLDVAFDGDGKLMVDFGGSRERVQSLAVEPDGKIIALGTTNSLHTEDFALARFNGNGSLDTGFDEDGMLTGYFPAALSELISTAVQNDGKIIVAGSISDKGGDNDDFVIARYHTDGTLDSSFDGDGMVITDFQNRDIARAVAIQDDGKIIVAGYSMFSEFGNASFALARYNSDGSPDNSFGDDGKVGAEFSGYLEIINALAIQNDGSIVVGGQAYDTSTFTFDFEVVRFNPNGTLDSSFDEDGKLFTDFFGSNDQVNALVIQPDGKILVSGYAYNSGNNSEDIALARYNLDGSLDMDFDEDGRMSFEFTSSSDEYGQFVAIHNDKIITGGYVFDLQNPGLDFAVARMDFTGSLDSSFGINGKLVSDIGGYNDFAFSIAVQSDGKFILTGYSDNPEYVSDIAIARYNMNGSLDSSFNNDGKLVKDFGGYDVAYSSCIDGNRLYVAGYSAGMLIRGVIATYQLGCIYYRDVDKDGYGDAAHFIISCITPQGYVADNTDCNDNKASIHPGAAEICGNRTDDNCDGQIDEGCPGMPFFTINDVIVGEALGMATLTITLSKKIDEPATVGYFTVDRTATSKPNKQDPPDYEAVRGTVTIPAGTQKATITIRIISDRIREEEEFFDVHLYHPVNAAVGDGKGQVTIIDEAAIPVRSGIITKSGTTDLQLSDRVVIEKLTVSVHPNPSSGYFLLNLQSSNNTHVSVKVYDGVGRLIEARAGVSANTTISVGHAYHPGFYFIEVIQGKERVVLKILKQ